MNNLPDDVLETTKWYFMAYPYIPKELTNYTDFQGLHDFENINAAWGGTGGCCGGKVMCLATRWAGPERTPTTCLAASGTSLKLKLDFGGQACSNTSSTISSSHSIQSFTSRTRDINGLTATSGPQTLLACTRKITSMRRSSKGFFSQMFLRMKGFSEKQHPKYIHRSGWFSLL